MARDHNKAFVADMQDEPSVRALFGRRVRELRKAKGYSQEGFAAVSGLDRSYYGRIERGEQNVSLGNIATIARALELPIRELFPASEPPPTREEAPGE